MLTKKEIEVMALRKKGLKQQEIAEKLNISQAAVSKFERNAKEKVTEAKKTLRIARKLGINPGEDIERIAGGDDE